MQVLVLDRQIRPVKFIKVQQQAMLSSSIQKFMFLIIFFFFLWNGLTVTKADQIHVVGDDAGWTVGGNLSYRSWAASKAFHVGDTIVFKYNKMYHNVLEVSRADYRSCNAASPIVTHNSGNDSILIKRKGHYLFICGVPGHCQGGQRVDIRVVDVKSNSAPAPLPTGTLPPPPPLTPPPGDVSVQPAVVLPPPPPLGMSFSAQGSSMCNKSCLLCSLIALLVCVIFAGQY